MNDLSLSKQRRKQVEWLEAELNKVPQIDCPIRHYFSPGLYAREITIPARTAIVGAVHTHDSLVILSAGHMCLATDAGPVEITAPHTFTCKAGSKNAAVALETSVWTNVFQNTDNETDIDKLAERYTESKASDLIGGSTNHQLAANKAVESIEA